MLPLDLLICALRCILKDLLNIVSNTLPITQCMDYEEFGDTDGIYTGISQGLEEGDLILIQFTPALVRDIGLLKYVGTGDLLLAFREAKSDLSL